MIKGWFLRCDSHYGQRPHVQCEKKDGHKGPHRGHDATDTTAYAPTLCYWDKQSVEGGN